MHVRSLGLLCMKGLGVADEQKVYGVPDANKLFGIIADAHMIRGSLMHIFYSSKLSFVRILFKPLISSKASTSAKALKT